MDKKEIAQLKSKFGAILYFVEDESEQEKMISILKKYNEQLKDSKIKEIIDYIMIKKKKNYYDLVEYLIKDIFDGKMSDNKKKAIYSMLDEIQPIVEKAERSTWDKIRDYFNWC